MNKKLCFVTSTRAEYGLLYWLMKEVYTDNDLDFQLVVTGMHLSSKFGNTAKEIVEDGWSVDVEIPTLSNSDSESDNAKSIATGITGMVDAFEKLKPDLVVVMGDRFELLSVASACVVMRIPIAHISGGEITEGAIDDQIRHAMTKFSHLHFVAAEEFAHRVRQMGEEEWRICVSGEPGLDNVTRLEKMSLEELENDLQISLRKNTALVTYHPVTLELDEVQEQIVNITNSLEIADLQYIVTYPNADSGHDTIIKELQKFQNKYPQRVKLVENLGQKRYISLLPHLTMMIGNSSSGIVETPSFNLPTVNIGTRQKGRTCADNVFHVGNSQKSILEGIENALKYDGKNVQNPYGNGNSSELIKDFIKRVLQERNRDDLLRKRFVDYNDVK